jgi:hypothetical protein
MMRRLSWKQHFALLLVGAAFAAVISMGVVASAHPHDEYYNAHWGQGALEGGIDWRFASDFPSGDGIRERIKDAAARWNNQNQSLMFDYEASQPDYDAFPFASCPPLDKPEKNAIHWGEVDPGIGVTSLCTFAEAGGESTATYHSFQIKMDSTVDWYTGADAPGYNDTDIQAPATHEFGHATGREVGGAGMGHFDKDWDVCAGTEQAHHTMCPTVFTNTWWDRTLNDHDKDVFDGKY